MNRKRRCEILIYGSRELSRKMAENIQHKHDIQVIEEPHNGLVMVKVRETAKNSLFYLGEVFVTEAKVKVGHALGIGIVKGHEPELSYDLAVIDAAYNTGLSEIDAWEELLVQEEAAIAKRYDAEASRILKTRVSFETMDSST